MYRSTNITRDLKAASEQFHHLETQRDDIGRKLKTIVTSLYFFSLRGQLWWSLGGNMSCPRHRITPFHVLRNADVLLPTRMSAYVLVPQLRERKRISARRRRKRSLPRGHFPARSLSFASFEELLVIDFPQSELEAPNGEEPRFPAGD